MACARLTGAFEMGDPFSASPAAGGVEKRSLYLPGNSEYSRLSSVAAPTYFVPDEVGPLHSPLGRQLKNRLATLEFSQIAICRRFANIPIAR